MLRCQALRSSIITESLVRNFDVNKSVCCRSELAAVAMCARRDGRRESEGLGARAKIRSPLLLLVSHLVNRRCSGISFH